MSGWSADGPPVEPGDGPSRVRPEALGSSRFREAHGVRYAYVTGAMYKGIASPELVVRVGRAGLLGYFGAGGLRPDRVAEAVRRIGRELGEGGAFGANLLCSPENPALENEVVSVYLAHGVRRVEAAAYVRITRPLVRYRVTGLRRDADGTVRARNSVMAKVSRPEIAAAFLAPPPASLVAELRAAGEITEEEAALAPGITMADDICAEADSGGHTDQRAAFALVPDLVALRDRTARERGGLDVRVGAAGGIGTPEAAAAAFVLRADFVLTGSVNQCTVEAGTSDEAKDLLADAGVADTTMVPAGDMFEVGARVQVLRKGLFFPARANKLYEVYRRHDSLDDIDERTARQIQDRYLGRDFDAVWRETREHYARTLPSEVERAEASPKHRMALVFKWYFVHANRLAQRGTTERRVDFQIQCGPAMGAFNQFVRGTPYEPWRARHPDDIAELLMTGAATLLDQRLRALTGALAPTTGPRTGRDLLAEPGAAL
ncbi:PfaD family polyunsaturated fatty acid/polyketide biosynthesis protein [Streptomyces sp. AJS327]|uniref:PfaD family polyunsaturated fatty acid/polyketide biosynthesis protein n=1 Tax=Streptomyces sp. AJS327 TaxID=2545265 RepID=UPI0015DE2329|nr:PfaD family polyunsaturated fatty acid/polyketide biosynthesis protein [Streptomyces sp. AJS327]MBA0052405.1 PfaD family polyunsaturated fatty acid/polyketide biosynthesis protein [Streptomyces sp. AJS327]